MPAEWERHAATWIAWPHHEADWPGKFEPISWVYAEIVRALGSRERVEILCENAEIEAEARSRLDAHGVSPAEYRLHRVPTNRSWLRDSAPTGVLRNDGSAEWINWGFNAWAKYDNYERDVLVGTAIAEFTGIPLVQPTRADGERLVLEGGGIEVNGSGVILVTEEWLLSDVQVRNPGMSRADYEHAFAEFLGASQTIWLGEGAVGDDTHGHIDDIARFCTAETVILAHEQDPSDENHRRSLDNLKRLRRAAKRRPLRIIELPFPQPVMMNGERLPASYANFYVANSVVLVPTFNDPNDRIALDIIAREFPGRDVVGIHSTDLVWGLGTLHCLSQQQPAEAK